MDLKNLMNDGDEEKSKQSQDTHKASQPLPPPPLVTDGQPPPPSSYGPPSQQQTPLYAPPSAIGSRPSQGPGLTPLQTPSQGLGAAQYPFPSHQAQSPARVHPSQQYRPYGAYETATPGTRPTSHGYTYPQPSPSQQYPAGLSQGMQAHTSSSLSPTPPSHQSQTPHSVRQSPLATFSHAPGLHSSQHQLQHSQPSTPLGPPPLYHQRSSNFADLASPYHHRSYSNTSNGIANGKSFQ